MYRAGARVASTLPAGAASSLAQGVGRLVASLPDLDGRRAVVASHMERVTGRTLGQSERRRMVAEVFANYGRYWAESLRLPSMAHDEVARGTAIVGTEHLTRPCPRAGVSSSHHLTWGAGSGVPFT